MANEENTPEKGNSGKSATVAGLAMALIGLCSVVAKGVFDHFDDIKLLLSPKVAVVASPSPEPKSDQTPVASRIESPAHPDTSQMSSPQPAPQSRQNEPSGGLRPQAFRQQWTEPPLDKGRSPAALVQIYYEALNHRSLQGAYDRLSTGFRSRRSLDDFGKIFAATTAVAVKQINEVALGENAATVFVQLMETDSDHREQRWEGNIYLIREQAGWRIERMDLRRF